VKPRHSFVLLAACFLHTLTACHSAKSILLTEQEEYSLAQEYMKDEKWEQAREHFQRLSDRFPGSALASEAVLGKAESFFLAKNYTEAQTEYQLFLEFYPAHEKADLAQFRVGLCQTQNMRSIDRDQTPTEEAVKTFQKFLGAYPKSSYAVEAAKHLNEAQERLKRHDDYVARFYSRRGLHLGSAVRYRRILDNYPLSDQEKRDYTARLEGAWNKFVERRLEFVAKDFENKAWFSVAESVNLLKHYRPELKLDERTSYAYAESLYQLNRQQESRAEFESFLQAFPQSAFAQQSRDRITELESKVAPKTKIEGQIEP
jgi:outer membrane assembly lipoprotein YfiO